MTSTSSGAFRAQDYVNDSKIHLLIASTGSVATIKLPLILRTLSTKWKSQLSIRVILSKSALEFLHGQSTEQPHYTTLAQIDGVDGVYTDSDEWTNPAWTRDVPILHVELRRWADALLIAPLSANSLAKIVNGMADNLVTSVIRAWDTTGSIDLIRPSIGNVGRTKAGVKRIWVAPAMNTAMWSHPITAKQMKVLEEEWGEENGGWFTILQPVSKVLACGDVGLGAMMEWTDIISSIESGLGLSLAE